MKFVEHGGCNGRPIPTHAHEMGLRFSTVADERNSIDPKPEGSGSHPFYIGISHEWQALKSGSMRNEAFLVSM